MGSVLWDDGLQSRFKRLGFVQIKERSLHAVIGNVQLAVCEHPAGAALFFTQVEPRTATHFDIIIPSACSAEQIAGLIYVNFSYNFHAQLDACKAYFEGLNVPLFQ